MITFTARILRFGEMGEKTGWMYIEIPADLASKLKPGCKKSFRVKGKLDNYPIEKTALLPMGQGTFIIPFNAQMRKGTGKRDGAMLHINLQADDKDIPLNRALLNCLADEPRAMKFFRSLAKSQRGYFSKWVDDARTESTKAKRIAESVTALSLHKKFSEMLSEKNGGDNFYARWREGKQVIISPAI